MDRRREGVRVGRKMGDLRVRSGCYKVNLR